MSQNPPIELISVRAVAISVSIVASQFVQMIAYGAGVVAATTIAADLGNANDGSWIAASYPLTQGAFVLMGGRVGAIYGHKNILLAGSLWWTLFSLVSGFAKNIVSSVVLRALTGIGGAFMVPNAIALLTITFPPGRQRNVTVAFFGAMAPIGAAGGSVFAGVFAQLLPWKYLFFFFQAPFIGWNEPYEYALLIAAVLHVAAFVYWEGRFAQDPILPLDIWTAPSFVPMILASVFSFMAVGIFVWYCNVWNLVLRRYSLLLDSATWVPLAGGGTVAALVSAWLVPKLDAQYILAIGSGCIMVSCVLVSTMPDEQVYWAQLFPAISILGFGPDFIFTATQIITSNTVRKSQQGIAGSLIGTIMVYGQSTGIGLASTVDSYTNHHGTTIGPGYRHALYLGIALSACAIIISSCFVRIPKDDREGWSLSDEGAAVGRQSEQTTTQPKLLAE
ncbi:putative MFS-type transporter [Hyphodiscus hymeniophilus]|uniref:MFS-type transporter n=1 Tax=Hyphodiscus hymeniophilus TaxID=353542 RepID=A0A9P6VRK6_9HELO|nr:putative MFS-type transporter [Hyphodiscus hymeniophilus]